MVDVCPTVTTWKTRGRPPEPDLAGLRDRTLLVVGKVGALRRSEISALDIGDNAEHPSGLVLALSRSKTNQHGDHAELCVLLRGNSAGRCRATALEDWIHTAGVADGPVLRPVSTGNRPLPRPLTAGAINDLDPPSHRTGRARRRLQRTQSPRRLCHLRHLRGASDRAIAHKTEHRSLAFVGSYIRIHSAWEDTAATQPGL